MKRPMIYLVTVLTLAGLSYAKSVDNEESRIFMGAKVTTHERPYQAVALLKKEERPEHSNLCSVVLIKENWVLTTSLCVLKQGSEIYFGTNKWCEGSGSSYSFQYDQGYQMRTVKQVIKNDKMKGRNAFVLAELNENVQLTENIQLAELAKESPKTGETFDVAGWGTVANGKPASCDLLKVSLPKMSDEDCKSVWGDEIYEDQFCAGFLGENKPSACFLDEGSALAKAGKVYALALKFKRFCGEPNTPSVYLSIAPFTDWISKQTTN